MSSLYCEVHGRKHEAYAKAAEDEMRRDGESTLIINGTLISGPWRCDSCNALLKKGDRASFHAIFSRSITRSICHYAFEYEREYFALEGSDQVTIYGAAWPGGSAGELLGSRLG